MAFFKLEKKEQRHQEREEKEKEKKERRERVKRKNLTKLKTSFDFCINYWSPHPESRSNCETDVS